MVAEFVLGNLLLLLLFMNLFIELSESALGNSRSITITILLLNFENLSLGITGTLLFLRIIIINIV